MTELGRRIVWASLKWIAWIWGGMWLLLIICWAIKLLTEATAWMLINLFK